MLNTTSVRTVIDCICQVWLAGLLLLLVRLPCFRLQSSGPSQLSGRPSTPGSLVTSTVVRYGPEAEQLVVAAAAAGDTALLRQIFREQVGRAQ